MSRPVLHAIKKGQAAAKQDAELRLAIGVVYFPELVDSQNDFMTLDEVRKSAWNFMSKGDTHCVDVNHDGELSTCHIVESFISRKGDPDFPIPGTWVVGMHIPDEELWGKVKKGQLNGFSFEAIAHDVKPDRTPELVLRGEAAVLKGATQAAEGHGHSFEIIMNQAGKIVGGRTSVHTDKSGATHFHEIKHGVVTGEAAGHRHRFTALNQLLENADDAA